MYHFYDRASFAHALTLDLAPPLEALLTAKIASLATDEHDLTDWTEFLVIEPGDTEDNIIRHVGFSPLVEPIDNARFGEPGFHPFWDHLATRAEWYEMIVTFGSTFAYVLLIEDADGVLPELRALCRCYA